MSATAKLNGGILSDSDDPDGIGINLTENGADPGNFVGILE